MSFSMMVSRIRRWRMSAASDAVMGQARVLIRLSRVETPGCIVRNRACAGERFDLAFFLHGSYGGFTRRARDSSVERRAVPIVQRVIADLLHDFLAFLGVNPVNQFANVSLRLAGNVPVEITADGVLRGQDVLHGGCNGWAAGILLYIEVLDAFAVSDSAVADAAGILSNGIDDCRSARKGLRGRVVVAILKDMFLEVDVGSGVVLAAIENDFLIFAANIFPVLDRAGVDGLNLCEREFGQGVGFIDVHGKAVDGDRQFEYILTTLGLDVCFFGVFHRARCFADIRGSVNESGDPRSGATASDLDG